MRKNLFLAVLLLVALVAFTIPVAAQSASNNDAAVSAVRPALAIKAPQIASVGEKVQIKVVALPGGAPVGGAGVWAVDIKDGGNIPTTSNSELNKLGTFLGWTEPTGIVAYIFLNPSRYLLIACKDGYTPGFAWITIQPLKKLVIRAPVTVKVLEPVAIRVVEKSVLTVEIPVPGAGVWAISMDKAAKLDNISDYTAFAKTNGIILGWTDQTGYVTPKPRFSSAGRYWLVAFKDGYAPCVSQITVTELIKATAVNPVSITTKNTP